MISNEIRHVCSESWSSIQNFVSRLQKKCNMFCIEIIRWSNEMLSGIDEP